MKTANAILDIIYGLAGVLFVLWMYSQLVDNYSPPPRGVKVFIFLAVVLTGVASIWLIYYGMKALG